jgi:hypothetical protein
MQQSKSLLLGTLVGIMMLGGDATLSDSASPPVQPSSPVQVTSIADIKLIQQIAQQTPKTRPYPRAGAYASQLQNWGICKRKLEDQSSGIAIYAIAPDKYLGIVQCYMGAYQPDNQVVYFSVSATQQIQVEFLSRHYIEPNNGKFIALRGKPPVWSGVIGFEVETRRLNVLSRSGGTCATQLTYLLDQQDLVLKRIKQDDNCRDQNWKLVDITQETTVQD